MWRRHCFSQPERPPTVSPFTRSRSKFSLSIEAALPTDSWRFPRVLGGASLCRNRCVVAYSSNPSQRVVCNSARGGGCRRSTANIPPGGLVPKLGTDTNWTIKCLTSNLKIKHYISEMRAENRIVRDVICRRKKKDDSLALPGLDLGGLRAMEMAKAQP